MSVATNMPQLTYYEYRLKSTNEQLKINFSCLSSYCMHQIKFPTNCKNPLEYLVYRIVQ